MTDNDKNFDHCLYSGELNHHWYYRNGRKDSCMVMANTHFFKIRRPHQFELMKNPVILFGSGCIWVTKRTKEKPKTINFWTIIVSVYSVL